MTQENDSIINRLKSRSFKAVVFDFDGTLLDVKNAMLTAIEEIFAENKIDFDPNSTIQEIGALLETLQGYPLPKILLNSHQIFKYITVFNGMTFMKKILVSTNIFAKYLEYSRQAPLALGTKKLLETLKKKLGYDLYIVSHNKKENIIYHLDKNGIKDNFNGIFGTDDLTALKPDPQALEVAIKDYPISVKRNEFIMIGDMPTDIKAGKEAGFYTIAIADGISSKEILQKSLPDLLVNDFTDLYNILNHFKSKK